MRLGLPWWIGAGPPTKGIELASDLGYQFVEISLDEPWPHGLSGPELRDACRAAGLGLGFHAPWRTQSIAHPRGVMARAAGTVAKECVDVAAGAGAEYVVFHVDARDFRRYPLTEEVQRGLGNARETLRSLAQGAGRDVTLLVENTSAPLATPSQLVDFLAPIPDVGFAFDPGHAAIAVDDGADGATADPQAWVSALGRRLVLTHLMDYAPSDRGIVDHLVPGAGTADVAGMLRSVREVGCERVLVEAFYRDLARGEATVRDLKEARVKVESLLA